MMGGAPAAWLVWIGLMSGFFLVAVVRPSSAGQWFEDSPGQTLQLAGWAHPIGPASPAFQSIDVGLAGNPLVYVTKVEAGSSATIAAGFCESHWSEPGKRLVDLLVEGKQSVTVDLIADGGGQNHPFVVLLEAVDSDRDGWLYFEVRANPASVDQNCILNALWLLPQELPEGIEKLLVTGQLDSQVLAFLDAGASGFGAADSENSVYLSGRRCVASVSPENMAAGPISFSPLEGVSKLTFKLDGAELVGSRTGHNWVASRHIWPSGVTGRLEWYPARQAPALLVILKLHNPASHPAQVSVSAQLVPNVGWFQKFAKRAPDHLGLIEGGLLAVDSEFPELKLVALTEPETLTWEFAAPPGVSARKAAGSTKLNLAPGQHKQLILLVAADQEASDTGASLRALAQGLLHNAEAEAAAVRSEAQGFLAATPKLITSVPALDYYFEQSKLWALRDTRTLPFGEPASLGEGAANELVTVLTASPVYHGVFANDCCQSALEWGLLGQQFYPTLEATLDALWRFGAPESVEWISGDGTIFCSSLKIGQLPQWVIGAAGLLLWSGDGRLVESFFPRIQQALERFSEFDSDGDSLDDWDTSTFPEHPDPRPWDHELLYASSFWYQAFKLGAEAAGLAGSHELSVEWSVQAEAISQAINRRFGGAEGYAGWLDADHNRAPATNHNIVLPLEYGFATPELASTSLARLLTPPSMTEWGPLHLDADHSVPGSGLVWAFMRWNLVHALFVTGRSDDAITLARKWAGEEAVLGYCAPEAFTPEGQVTSRGYSWTAGRSVRALLFGLLGLELKAGGLELDPHLPSDWGGFQVEGLELRGVYYDIEVKRANEPGLWLDGMKLPGSLLPALQDDDVVHHLLVQAAG